MRRTVATLVSLVVIGVMVWKIRDFAAEQVGDPSNGDHFGRTASREEPSPDASLEGRVPDRSGTEASYGDQGADDAQAPQTSSLVVTTLDGRSGVKLAGVTVVGIDVAGRRHEATSDGDGSCVLEGLPRGAVRVAAGKPGWIAASTEVEVGPDAREKRVLLLPSTSARGRVVRASDGEPVARATVIAAGRASSGLDARAGHGDVWGVETTDAEGRFALAHVPRARSLHLTVLASGYARLLHRIEIGEGETAPRELRLTLHPGATLRGLVVDRSGDSVPEAAVYVYADDDELLQADPRNGWSDGLRTTMALAARADADGRFAVHGLALGVRYTATAFVPTDRRAVDVKGLGVRADGSVAEARLVVPDPIPLEVFVLDTDGSPLRGARVAVAPAGRAYWPDEDATPVDERGRVRFPLLGPGEQVVHALCTGYVDADETVSLSDGTPRRVEIRLRPEAVVRGVVVDARGRPRPGGIVRGRTLDGDFDVPARVDEQGRFRLEGLPPGPVELRLDGRPRNPTEPLHVEAPVDDVRLVARPETRVQVRLLLPSGTPAPPHLLVGIHNERGGGTTRSEAWGDGRLSIRIQSGQRILRIEGEGFAQLERRVDVETGTTLDLGEISLSPGITSQGTVVDAEGSPIPGAVVTAVGQEGRTAQTDEQGVFAIVHVRPDRLALCVEAEGYVDRWWSIRPDDVSRDQRIVLVQGALLRLRVFDAAGLPARMTDVNVVPTDIEKDVDEAAWYARAEWSETDEQGRLELRVAPGAYLVTAAFRGRAPFGVEVVLEEGETRELELRPR